MHPALLSACIITSEDRASSGIICERLNAVSNRQSAWTNDERVFAKTWVSPMLNIIAQASNVQDIGCNKETGLRRTGCVVINPSHSISKACGSFSGKWERMSCASHTAATPIRTDVEGIQDTRFGGKDACG